MDTDSDNDGLTDQAEGATDTDGDGIPDRLESNIIDTDDDGNMDYNDNNADDDAAGPDGTGGEQAGVLTGPWNDVDGDSIPDHLDADTTNAASMPDGSGDGDGDGISDALECSGGYICPDSDDDGTPDYMDTDSDNDGLTDQAEGILDTDADGIPDRLESNITDTDGDGNMDYNDANADGDAAGNDGTGGEQDGVETGPWNDADNDGIPDHLDASIGNGSGPTVAGSGDSDGDGTADGIECPNGIPCPDTNNDGTPEYMQANADSDGDSIPDAEEMAGPNNGDGNNDGTPDKDQSSVATLLASDNFSYVTAEVTGACNTIAAISHTTEAAQASTDTFDYPFGLMAIRLNCASNGQAATVKYYWHAISDLTGLPYRKYGPMTPGGSSKVWYDFPVTYGTASPAGVSIATSTMQLVDGEMGDDTVADSVIIDPSGPANATQKSTLGDWVWYDVNGDGVKDVGEQGINGVIINLYLDTGDGIPQPGELVTTTTTGNDGGLVSGRLIDSDDVNTGEPGAYDFQVLDNQIYIVEIDAANFLPGGALENYIYTGENAANAYNGANPRVVLIGVQQDYNDADFPFMLLPSVEVGKMLNTVNTVVRPGDTVSFTIQVTNTGFVTITTLPLLDRYNSAFLQFDSGNGGNSPAPDSAATGQLTWNNLAPAGGLAPLGVVSVDVYFTALADTTLLLPFSPCTAAGEAPNIAQVMNAVADPDGAGPQPGLAVTDADACASVRIEQPTAVNLTNMGVTQTADGVLIQWDTITEADTAGFRVLHSNGVSVNQVNPATVSAANTLSDELIPAQNAGQSSGASYSVLDAGATLTRGDVYVLETVHTDGSTERNVLGVFSNTPLYLPLVMR
ncbi:MAG: SdrD B-like domain-containing protein [Caldilineaceae bacterium]